MSRYFLPHINRMAGYVPGEQPRDGGFIKLNTMRPLRQAPSTRLPPRASLGSTRPMVPLL